VLGLEETQDDVMFAPEPQEVGVSWLALAPEERRAREADLLAALRSAAAASDHAMEVVVDDDLGSVGVWMDRWKAPALERELLDQVGREARQRQDGRGAGTPEVRRHEVDRTVRAHVLVGWDRHAWKAFVGAMTLAGLLGWYPWGDLAYTALAVAGGVAGVVVIRTRI
jgi:hypothetical protein